MTTRGSLAGLRLGLTAAFTVAVGFSTATPQQPTFRAQVDLVRLDVLVVRDGRPVPGLTKADFEVRDNGVVHQIDHVGFAQVPLDVMLVLDTSKSVVGEKLQHLQEASHAFLDGLASDDRAGLLTFNEVITVGSDLTSDVGQGARSHRARERARRDGGSRATPTQRPSSDSWKAGAA